MSPWWLRLLRLARIDYAGLSTIILLMLMGIGIAALMPWPMKLIVDHVLPNKPFPDPMHWLTELPGATTGSALLGWLAIGTILLFILQHIVRTVKAYVQSGVSARLKFSLARLLFDHLQQLSLRYHGTIRTGDTVRRVSGDTNCVRQIVLDVILPLFTSVITLVTMVAILWQLDRSLALVSVLAAVPLPIIMKRLYPRMKEYSYERHQTEGQLMTLAEQTLSALPVVQAFGREKQGDERFHGLSGLAIRAYLRTIVAKLQFKISVGTTTALGTAVVMIVGSVHVVDGLLTVGGLLVFLSYLGSMYGAMETLAYLSTSYADAAAQARRVLEILDTKDAVKERPGARPLLLRDPKQGQGIDVRLEDVTFGYQNDKPVLEDLSLEACAGETIALIGATGAGKTTLVSLILRFFDPWKGRVLIDGIDVREVQLASLRSQIALVLQEPFLLPLTVAENIAYGRPQATGDEVIAAAVAANADEFIRRLPDGYETVIGERGATLSGGQRQRLAIARALLKDAPLLILDEPTSALDAETETLLLEALQRLTANRTTFIIAHRLSTIRHADRIIVLDAGRVAENGTHEQLWCAAGMYRHLYDLQFLGDDGQSLDAPERRKYLHGASV